MDFYRLVSESGKLTPEECDSLHKYVDASKLIIAACKLKHQYKEPTRMGMIDALKSSLSVANQEIRLSEAESSAPCTSPQYVQFEQLSNNQLHSLIPVYFKGLEQRCINEFGKELYEKCLKIVWDNAVKNGGQY